MSKIILFSHRPVFQKGLTSGPGIRIFEIAKALAEKGHKVSLAEKEREKQEVKNKVKFIAWNEELLEDINKKFDVVFIQNWCSNPIFLDKISCLPIIVDIYSPYLMEHVYYHYKLTRHGFNDFATNVMIPYITPFLYGDFFICANEEQMDYYNGVLTTIGRINPGISKEKIMDIVPNGLKRIKIQNKHILKKKIGDKKIILWPGGFFPWLDPLTTINAIEEVKKKENNVALVFVGANNPNAPQALTRKYIKEIKKYIKAKQLEKNVFFLPWLKQQDYFNLFAETDICIVTHKKTFESRLSSRSRTLDAIQTATPVITTNGDPVSNLIKENKLGFVVKEKDYKNLAEKIILILEKERKNIASRQEKFLKKSLDWKNTVSLLDDFCKKPRKDDYKIETNPYSIINETIKLSKTELEAKNKEINEEKINKQIEIVRRDEEIRQRDEIIKQQTKYLQNKDEQINNQTKLLRNKEREATELLKIINKQRETIEKISTIIGRFKGSVTYPFYKLTSKIGRTYKKLIK